MFLLVIESVYFNDCAYLLCSVLSLYRRGQTSSPTSGPVKMSGRPVCVETLSWNGLLSYRTGSR